jgi:hypothetical protein
MCCPLNARGRRRTRLGEAAGVCFVFVFLFGLPALALSIGALSIASDWTENNNCISTVAPGGSCTIHVTFTPKMGGNRAGTLTPTENGLNRPQTIALAGKGVADDANPSTQPVPAGLMAWYQIPTTDNPAALTDFSGNGNNGIGTQGTAPPILPSTGGIACGGAGGAILPVALNSAQTIQLFFGWQNTLDTGGSGYSPLILGNYSFAGPGTDFGIFLRFGPDITALWSSSGTPGETELLDVPNGNGMITDVLSSTSDTLYLNSTTLVDSPSPNFGYLGIQNSGSYQLCGANTYYLTGNIYQALFYNRQLAPNEIASNVAAINAQMQARGVHAGWGSVTTTPEIAVVGDSISAGFGSGTPWPNYLFLNNPSFHIDNRAEPVLAAQNVVANGATSADTLCALGQPNVLLYFLGSNDVAYLNESAAQAMVSITQYLEDRQGAACAWKTIPATMLSRSNADTAKNSLNALMRGPWQGTQSAFVDLASDPRLGADGAYSNTEYFFDGVHPTTFSDISIIAPLWSRAVNRLFGNLSINSSTTYTAGSPGAGTITAASETQQTATITVNNTAVAGQPLLVRGMTPAGYNVDGVVASATPTQITYTAMSTGLGPGTAFGTALVPTQQDADVNTTLGTISSNQTFQLETCVGYTGQYLYLNDSNTNASYGWTLQGWNGEMVGNANTLAVTNGSTVVLQSALVSASAAGCYWTVATSAAGTGLAPVVSLTPSSLTFGSQVVGTTTGPQSVTLTNTGSGALTISSIAISANFGQTNNCAGSAAASGSCTINVTFSPTAPGPLTGTLSVADNVNGSPQTIALSGTGQDFSFAPPSGSTTSANVAPGQPAGYTLSVGGEGGLSGTVTFICTGAPSEASCTVSPNPVTAGSSATNVTVVVTTTAPSASAPRSRHVPPIPPLAPGLKGLLMLTLVLAAAVWAITRRTARGESGWQSALVPVALGLVLTLALASCGGGGGGGGGTISNPGTPAGTYTLTVTGTAGSGSSALSHSVTLTLTVS